MRAILSENFAQISRTFKLMMLILYLIIAFLSQTVYSTVPTAVPTALSGSITYPFTGQFVEFIVPSGAVSLHVKLVGASGGDAINGYKGARGAKVEGFIPVSSMQGSTIYINVGGKGTTGSSMGGFNGGGNGVLAESGSGGGATDIRYPTNSLADRKVVAGGGGGGDAYCEVINLSGSGGHPSGGTGSLGTCNSVTYNAAGGGSQSSPGMKGSSFANNAFSGSFGLGGNGCGAGGAGGGGGYYGGGGACGGSGGGGSSFVDPSLPGFTHTSDANTGPGYLVIGVTYAPSALPTTAPTVKPTASPSAAPTRSPTVAPTASPSAAPTRSPTVATTSSPSADQTRSPTVAPTPFPSVAPTRSPTASLTVVSAAPSVVPDGSNLGCALDWVRYGNKCFRINTSISSAQPCEASCESAGATLPCVESAAENTYLSASVGGLPVWLDATADSNLQLVRGQNCVSQYQNATQTPTYAGRFKLLSDGTWRLVGGPARCVCQRPAVVLSTATSRTFLYTGSVQMLVTPFNLKSMTVSLYGASGGDSFRSLTRGGKGAKVVQGYSYFPGNYIVYVHVGAQGRTGIATGGYNGGGNSTSYYSGSGGGATDIRSMGLVKALVAGGGGGGDYGPSSGCVGAGGSGGYPMGQAGGAVGCAPSLLLATGGNQTTGGDNSLVLGAELGLQGQLSLGGAGCPAAFIGGAGGGGGYYGGGGGCNGTGAAGGSSYVLFETAVTQNAVNVGDGYAVVDFEFLTAAPTAAPSAAPACPIDWVQLDGVCYGTSLSYVESDMCEGGCAVVSAVPVCIDGENLNTAVAASLFSAQLDMAWTGMRVLSVGNISQPAGCSSTFTSWMSGQPGSAVGGVVYRRTSQEWVVSSSGQYRCMCQTPAASASPSAMPTVLNTNAPTIQPTAIPTRSPTSAVPSLIPTLVPTATDPGCPLGWLSQEGVCYGAAGSPGPFDSCPAYCAAEGATPLCIDTGGVNWHIGTAFPSAVAWTGMSYSPSAGLAGPANCVIGDYSSWETPPTSEGGVVYIGPTKLWRVQPSGDYLNCLCQRDPTHSPTRIPTVIPTVVTTAAPITSPTTAAPITSPTTAAPSLVPTPVPSITAPGCPLNWRKLDGVCYGVTATAGPFDSCSGQCDAEGALPVCIFSYPFNNYLGTSFPSAVAWTGMSYSPSAGIVRPANCAVYSASWETPPTSEGGVVYIAASKKWRVQPSGDHLNCFCRIDPTDSPTTTPSVTPTTVPTVMSTAAPSLSLTANPTSSPTVAPSLVPTSVSTVTSPGCPLGWQSLNGMCYGLSGSPATSYTQCPLLCSLAESYPACISDGSINALIVGLPFTTIFAWTGMVYSPSAGLTQPANCDSNYLNWMTGQPSGASSAGVVYRQTSQQWRVESSGTHSCLCQKAAVVISPVPTPLPTAAPTRDPTPVPIVVLSSAPTAAPTRDPTPMPTVVLSATPTAVPTRAPTSAPTAIPTRPPTGAPTAAPTKEPTRPPTKTPTRVPTSKPTTHQPTYRPSKAPTTAPSARPSAAPTHYCPPGYSTYGDICYLFDALPAAGLSMSCSDLCASQDADMLCIEDDRQNQHISDTAIPHSSSVTVLLGLERQPDGEYTWPPGCHSQYQLLNTTGSSTGRAVVMRSDGGWISTDDTSNSTCACQMSSPPEPVPTTVVYEFVAVGEDLEYYYDITKSPTYTVPEHVGPLFVTMTGASGGSVDSYSGGLGGVVTAELNIAAGTLLYATVAGQGASGDNWGGYFNGGYTSSSLAGSGGGMSFLWLWRNETESELEILAIAGGGGGADANPLCPGSGGDAGYPSGQPGQVSGLCLPAGGGNQTHGGVGGVSGTGRRGYEGRNFGGGGGKYLLVSGLYGAGGGAGYYGGGGSAGGGGGGGSSYVNSSYGSAVYAVATAPGNGRVVISYTPVPSAAPTARPTSAIPTVIPTAVPSASPTLQPSVFPSAIPSHLPTAVPSHVPTAMPSVTPSADPTPAPSKRPTASPSTDPTPDPSERPTATLSASPSADPSALPIPTPTHAPTHRPTTTSPAPTVYLDPTVTVFEYIGAVQEYTVPDSAVAVSVTVLGASGSGAFPYSGGRGAVVQTSIPVQPGDTLYVHVGGRPAVPQAISLAVGDFNGGGDTASAVGAGGGASDIRYPGPSLEDRVVVAGGGGGADAFCGGNGGDAGYPNGFDGEIAPDCTFVLSAGAGGNQSAGGVAGTTAMLVEEAALVDSPIFTDPVPTQGTLSLSDEPSSAVAFNTQSISELPAASAGGLGQGGTGCYAGGGGGYYGGGGTCGGGGGGGSSYCAFPATFQSGSNTGNGRVVIQYLEAWPTSSPTAAVPTLSPTLVPSTVPSGAPTVSPSTVPSAVPSDAPTVSPSTVPSDAPTVSPSTVPSGAPTVSPSTVPSAVPSDAPTVSPSTVPSGAPTVSPSNVPSAVPSDAPTVSPSTVPTAVPSGAPTVSPSTVPSGVPTVSPSTVPSAVPSGAPTVSPSTVPSAMPSVSPSTVPTVAPTGLPTRSPSAATTVSPTPSGQPTCLPTLSPSVQPTARPTESPSCDPSAHPTQRPSIVPTTAPSVGPTLKPTLAVGETRKPSSAPTAAPTLSAEAQWREALSTVLADRASARTADTAQRVSYFELDVGTTSPSAVYGSCSNWKSLVTGELTTSQLLYAPLSLQLTVQSALGAAAITLTCADSSAVKAILRDLSAASSSSAAATYTCDQHSWVVKQCAGVAQLCVDCADPCSSLRCASAASSSTAFALSPCVSPACGVGRAVASAVRVLSVNFKDLEPAPAILSRSVQTAKTSLSVSAALSSRGTVHCAAYQIDAKTGASSVPSSTAAVLLQNFAATTNAANVSVVTVSGLQAATDFMLYCMATSPTGTQTALAEVVSKATFQRTACCIPVTLRTATSSVKAGTSTQQFASIAVDARPADSVVLTLSAYAVDSSSGAETLVSPSPFFPASFTVSALQQQASSTGSASQGLVLTASLRSLSAGAYRYELRASGQSALQYEVLYASASQTLTVLSAQAALPAPVLSSAAFSDDGSKVLVSFDASTDRAGTAAVFPCSALLDFACAASSTCMWSGDAALSVVVSNGAQCAALNSRVALASSAVLKARCQTASCNTGTWPAASTAVAVNISSPTNAVAPTIAVSAPSTVGECDSLTLDLSGSSGSGGRAWLSRSIKVETLASANVTALQRFLDNTYKASPPTPIPSALLSTGFAYTFKVTLCNFLGKCGQTTRRVLVQASAVPVVSLPGGALRRTKRSAALTISSDASFTRCGAGVTRSGLSYAWTVSQAGAVLLGADTSSKDPSKLLLPAYSLQAGTVYDITLRVTIAATQQSATSAVQVFVQPGSVVSVVSLGTSRSVRVEQLLAIDASSSYDEDKGGVTGTAAGLQYSWSCLQTAPSFQTSCDGVFSAVAGTSPAVFTVRTLQTAADAVAEVAVTIVDSSGSRTASSVVTVTVLPSLSPVVSVASNVLTAKFNPNQELRLTGTVSLPASFNGTATWSAEETDSFKLIGAVRSGLVTVLPASGTAAVQSRVYLALAANTLPPGATLTFYLTARLPSTGMQSTSALSVVVNAAPQSGTFQVVPAVGVEIADPFSFLADRWFDADLPLLYQFSYLTTSGVEATVRSKAERAFATAALPAGLSSSNFTVTCVVLVLDSLSASTTSQYRVVVKKAAESRSAARTSSLITTGLAQGSSNLDDLKRATALGSYLLNEVDCAQAPDCAARNRLDCAKTSQTCGSCLSTEYVGEGGDSNEPCVPKSALSSRRLSAAVGAACSGASDCGVFQSCSSGRCAAELKDCRANCSFPQGSCGFVHADSGAPLPVCYQGELHCRAVCGCTEEFVGSETCSLNRTELLQKQALREQVVQGVLGIIDLEDADQDTVLGWIHSLDSVSQVPDELSADTIGLVWEALQNVTRYGQASGLSVDALTGMLSTVNAATQAIADSKLPGRRRLESTNVDSGALVLGAVEALSQYRSYASAQLLPGQDPVQVVLPQFRMHVQSLPLSSTEQDADVSVALPQSVLEALDGVSAASVKFPIGAQSLSEASLVVSLSSMRAQLFNEELGLTGYEQIYSNPLTLEFANLPCADASSCRYEVELQMTASMQQALQQRSPTEVFNVTCVPGDFNRYPHTCATGDVVAAQCEGLEATISTRCPEIYLAPACNVLAVLQADSSACTVAAYTETSVTCSCPVFPSDRRLAAAGNGTVSATQSISYVAMMAEVKDNFVSTVLGAQGLSLDSIRKGWAVLLTIGVFAAAALFGLHWSYKADLESTKVKPALADKTVKAVSAVERRSKMWKNQYNKKGLSGDAKMAEEALPMILSSGSLGSKVADELKHHHKWFGIVFFYSKSFPRVLRVISLATNVLIMLFIQSLTYALTNPDDGSCELLQTEADCLAPDSPYATGASKCYWDVAKSSGDQCALVQPDSDVMVIVFVAIFSALVSTPLALLVDWIVMRILASPLKVPTAASRTASIADPSHAVLSAVPGGVSSSSLVAGAHTRRRGGNFRLSSLFGFDGTSVMAAENSAKLKAQTDLRLMVSRITEYRQSLAEMDRAEFDAVWGLDETGHFKTDAENSSQLLGRVAALARSTSSADASQGSVAQRVLAELTAVHTSLALEQDHCAETRLSAKEKGKRLMFLFQCDLLPGVSGKILEAKSSRDNMRIQQVSWQLKCAGWVFITLLNLAMLTYILLFALNQSVNRQGAWALSFLLWLVVEILLVSSLTVLFTHVLVPSLIMKDVNQIKAKLVDSIRAFNNSIKQARSGGEEGNAEDGQQQKPFSSTDFLFVSSRLAKQWSGLREAKIIAQFRTPWPKQSYQREASVSGMYSKKFSALGRSASILAIFFLSNLLQVPPSLQDMLVQMLTTTVVGYTVVIHVDLYRVFPVLVVLPVVVVAVVLHFVIQSRRAQEQLRRQKLLGEGDRKYTCAPKESRGVRKFAAIMPEQGGDEHPELDSEDRGEPIGALHTPAPSTAHVSRRASAIQGMCVLDALHRPERPAAAATIIESAEGFSMSSEMSCSSESVSTDEDVVAHPRSRSAKPAAEERKMETCLEELELEDLSASEAPDGRGQAAGTALHGQSGAQDSDSDSFPDCLLSDFSDDEVGIDTGIRSPSPVPPRSAGQPRAPSPVVDADSVESVVFSSSSEGEEEGTESDSGEDWSSGEEEESERD